VRSHLSDLEKGTDTAPALTAEFITRLFAEVVASLKKAYKTDVGVVDYNVLYALVYGKSIRLSDAGMMMIRRSIITNVLPDAKEPNPFVVPRGSLFMLACMSGKSMDLNGKNPPDIDILNPFHCFAMLLRNSLLTLVGQPKGASLELITEWWIKCRLAAAFKNNQKSVSLDELFPFFTDKVDLIPHIAVPRVDDYYISTEIADESLPNISSISIDDTAYLSHVVNEFNRATLEVDSHRCAYFESPVGQSFDHFIAMSVVEPGHSATRDSPVFVTVIDNKSGMVTPDDTSGQKTLDCSQFDRFQLMVEELKKLNGEENLELSRISRALVEGRYQFVYLTTYQKVKPTLTKHKKETNLVICNAKMSKSFYGMTWPLVISI
jgi:hypothetical protein